MRDSAGEIEALGADLAVIGSGRPQQAKAFAQRERIPFPLLVDPSMKTYRAANLRRGIGFTLGRGSLKHALRAWKAGFRQGWTQGDPWQQGGTFVITPDGRTLLEHVSAEAGDFVPPARIVEVLRER